MLSWRLRFLLLCLIFGSIFIRDVTGKTEGKLKGRSLNGMHKISASSIFAKTVVLQLVHNSDFGSVLSGPLDEDLLSDIGKAISEALVKEFKKPDPVLVTAYVSNALQKASSGADPEKYAKALMGIVSQVLVGYRILNWKNIFKIADKVMNDIVKAVSLFIPTTTAPAATTPLPPPDSTTTALVLSSPTTIADIEVTPKPDTSITTADETEITPTMIPEQMAAPAKMLGTTPEIKPCKCGAAKKASRKIDKKQKSPISDRNVITINIADLINIFKKDLAKRLRQDRYFKSVFSDDMLPSSLNTLSSAIAHFLAKAFKVPRTTLLPLENKIISLVRKGTSSPEVYAEKISNDLGLILRTTKILSPCVLKIQVSMAEKAILSAIETFLNTSRASGIGICMNGNSYSSQFSILNGLDMLPYVGPNAISQKFSPIKKAAKSLEQSTKFSKALYVNLISCSKFNEQFLLGVPKSSFKLIANTLGNFMAQAFGTCSSNYFAEEYSKALLSNQEPLSYKTYAKILSIATTKVLYSLGYFVSGSAVLQAAIASNAVMKALSPERAYASRDFAKAMKVPWGMPIVGARPIDLSVAESRIRRENFDAVAPFERRYSLENKKTLRKKKSKKAKQIRKKRGISKEGIFASYNDFPTGDTDYADDPFDLYFSDDADYMDLESVKDDDMMDFDAPDDDDDDFNAKGNDYLNTDKAKVNINSSGKTKSKTKGKRKAAAEAKAVATKSGVRSDPGVRYILDILPKFLEDKLYPSTAVYTSVSLVGIRKVIDLFAQAIAVHFGYEPAAYFINAYNKNLGGKANPRVKAGAEIEAGIEALIETGAITRSKGGDQGSSREDNGNKKEDPEVGRDNDEVETFICPTVTINAKSKKSGLPKMPIMPEEEQLVTLKIGDENTDRGIGDSGVTSEMVKTVTPITFTSEAIDSGGDLQIGEGIGIARSLGGEILDLKIGAEGSSGGMLSVYDDGDDDNNDDGDADDDDDIEYGSGDGDEIDYGSGDGEEYIDDEDVVPSSSSKNKRAGLVFNNMNSDFELCIPALAKALTEALKVAGILNTNFSLLTADQLAVALVAKLSSLIATSLDAKGLDNDLTLPYNLNRNVLNPSINYGLVPKVNYDVAYNSLRKAGRQALENYYTMYGSKNRDFQYGSEYYDDLLL